MQTALVSEKSAGNSHLQSAWIAVLLLVCYFPTLRQLVGDWIIDEDMGHGFFVPAVAGYIAWQRRGRIAASLGNGSASGLVLVFWGMAQALVATLGAELFLSRIAFIISLTGVIAFLYGWRTVRVLAFPLGLLFFMVPMPSIIYNQITFPLQLLASTMAEYALNLIGIPALREGNVLELPSQRLSVVEACSGIRSLLSLSFLSLVYGYFFDSRAWVRPVLFALTIPIALSANAFRVTITGILSEVNPELAKGLMHSAEGWVIFLFALVMLLASHRILNKMFPGKQSPVESY
jgi:exosortase